MDFPTAWRLLKTTKLSEHHPKCSYRQMDRGLLCDCEVLKRLKRDVENEAVHIETELIKRKTEK